MDQTIFAAARRLIENIAAAWVLSGGEGTDEVVQRLSEQKLDQAGFAQPDPRSLPVLTYLPECVSEAQKVDIAIASDIAVLGPHLRWLQSSSYTDAALGEGFTANYGWAEIIGPKGFFPGNDFLLGLLMLGPHRHYRDHFHPAPELYWPLTPRSQWRRDPGGFEEKPAGAIIWHQPHQIHATITEEKPMLAVWSWPRDTATPARLVE